MSKFLLYTQHGDGLGLAGRLKQEGEQVSIFFADKQYSRGLKNMVVSETSFGEAIKDRPIVIFDMVGAGMIANRLKAAGIKVIGAGMGKVGGMDLGDKIELDRKYAMDLMDAMKIMIPRMENFSKIDDAIAFAKENPGRWVIKPSGNLPTDMTYVARDTQDLISQLTKFQLDRSLKGEFMLQEFKKGTEISTEVFFSNGKAILPPDSTFETKKYGCFNKGANTGCQTSIVWGYREQEPKMYQKTIKKMLKFMETTGYTGPLDINCIVSHDDGDTYGLEFCPRFGYSAVYAMLMCLDMPLAKFLTGLADGTLQEIPWKPGFGGAARVSVPPYPFDTIDKKLKQQLYYDETFGLEVSCDFNDPHYIPLDVMKEDWQSKKYIVAGTDGVVLEALGYGQTIDQVSADVYKYADKVGLADNYYRKDMAYEANPRWKKLVQMGFVRGVNNGISA